MGSNLCKIFIVSRSSGGILLKILSIESIVLDFGYITVKLELANHR